MQDLCQFANLTWHVSVKLSFLSRFTFSQAIESRVWDPFAAKGVSNVDTVFSECFRVLRCFEVSEH